MQTIAGVHFNYSMAGAFWPAYQEIESYKGSIDALRSESYFGLVRNFQRFGWLILYLFGASPALCKSFASASGPNMPLLDDHTLYQPFSTSLRMSDLGYSNRTQARINISLNDLDEYVNDLSKAIRTPEPAFEKFGTKVDGEYRQLSINQLQIENEYYSPVRPKRVARSGERPTSALKRGGVEYVEIRSIDINPFDPVGINQNAMRFVEAFAVYCLLQDSPPMDDRAWDEAARNHTQTAKSGRDPEFRLLRDGKSVPLSDWGSEIMRDVRMVAELIDRGDGGNDYSNAVEVQAGLLADSELTPSARVLNELQTTGADFFEFAMSAAKGHKDYFRVLEPMQPERYRQMKIEAVESLDRQRDIEASDKISLDEYLDIYFGRNPGS
jgi:glutamate--cysteine ligase